MTYEYAIIEWLWDNHSIRINLPGNEENLHQGSYKELVEILGKMGKESWEVVTTVAGGDWILWTLKRPLPGNAGNV